MASTPLTFYAVKACPAAHRRVALTQAKAKHTRYEVDLMNKPEWYSKVVNPFTGKVPSIAYGGPPVAPDQPSSESAKIPESLVLVEFVADLYPDAGILPRDPFQRAKIRFFIEVVSSNYVSNYAAYILTGAPATVLLEGAEAIQALLPKETKFAFGNELTAADIAIAPYLLRTKVLLAARGNSDVWPTFQSDEFSRLWKYYQDLEAHPSIAGCYDEAHNKMVLEGYFAASK